ELYGSPEQKDRAFRNLTSRDPEKFWTSGQWMTERTGGSDVSGTSTIARQENQGWNLEGIKWFTSATTSPMALLLARTEGAAEGSRGLSLFYTELRDKNQKLQNIEILRLKDKLGTKALATAELKLNKTPAEPVGELGSGVKKISSLFNITRIYNSVCATSHMRRALDLAQDYSQKRQAFGKLLVKLPLHKSWLEHLEQEWARCFKLTFFVAELLGKDEMGKATETEKLLLRGLTPIVKLYTAKKCMQVVSEVVEIFGGAGYCEDTGIPKLLRDAQVFSIWEGATNVLALDFLRAVQKEGVLQPILEKAQNAELNKLAQTLVKEPAEAESRARELCFLIGDS
ncbi:MAG: acyl-CoA dehydrogenase family protein, partial [Bdellovibrionota bacterium]